MAEPAPRASARAAFSWEDPLLRDDALDEDERLVRDSAREYCDKATAAAHASGDRTVVLNNLGVLNAISGHLEVAAENFGEAARSGCLGECNESASTPRDLPRPVARRNQERNAAKIAAREQTAEQDRLVSMGR